MTTLESNPIKATHSLHSSMEKLNQTIMYARDSKAVKKQKSRGKLTARERLDYLTDGKPYLELSLLAGYEIYEEPTPSAGILCAIIDINEQAVMVIANDACVKAGAYYPLTVKKHLRALEIASNLSLPCLYLVDSAGAFLPKQHELFADQDGFGAIFYHQAQLSAQGIYQLAVVMGPCTAGGAYVPGMSDEVIMVNSPYAHMYLAGPPLVKAAIGEHVSSSELGGHDLHQRLSGVAHHGAKDEYEALNLSKRLIHLQSGKKNRPDVKPIDFKPPSDILDHKSLSAFHHFHHEFDMSHILNTIEDAKACVPYQSQFGKTLLCHVSSIAGFPVGIMANQGVLTQQAAIKGSRFLAQCKRKSLPIIFCQNIAGFMVGKDAEANAIIAHGADLVRAVSCYPHMKLTIIMGGSHGAGNYAMCGRAFKPTFLWSWPTAETSIMSAHAAKTVMQHISQDNNAVLDELSKHQSALSNTARCLDDGIIMPDQTRRYIIQALNLYYHGKLSASEAVTS